METPAVSIIIPTLDEADTLPRTMAALATWRPTCEIIVADGGSDDATMATAITADKVLIMPSGRARQMNAGAACARGEVLLFLHADTVPAQEATRQIIQAMSDPAVVGGAMRFALDQSGWLLGVVTWAVNLRSRLLRLPYGDQGIFLRRQTFEALGGYRDLPIMEDVDLVQRMRRLGRLVILPAAATTSARRWRTYGVVRTTLMNATAIALFTLGVPPRHLRRVYDAVVGKTSAARRPLDASERSHAETTGRVSADHVHRGMGRGADRGSG